MSLLTGLAWKGLLKDRTKEEKVWNPNQLFSPSSSHKQFFGDLEIWGIEQFGCLTFQLKMQTPGLWSISKYKGCGNVCVNIRI